MSSIVWNKNGLLAYVRGQTVCVTWPRCIDGANWELIPPIVIPVNRKVKQLLFSQGYDLAIIDETGKIEVVEILPGGQHKFKTSWLSVSDPRQRPTELDKVVGAMWLSNGKSICLPTVVPPMRKSQPTAPEASQSQPTKPTWETIKPSGPVHPVNGKSCLVAVTGNGMLRVIVELPDSTYREECALLPSSATISAATFCALGDGLLVATYFEGSILVYKVQIQYSETLAKGAPSTGNSPPVNITVLPVGSAAVKEPVQTELNVFELIQSPLNQQAVPVIHAIFSGAETSQVMIYKLNLTSQPLSPAFAKLQSQSSQQQKTEEVWQLTLFDTKTTTKPIKSYFMTKTAIIITYKDSSIESQNLMNVPVLLPTKQLHFDLESTENICFSPNICMVAELKDGVPHLHSLSCDDLPNDKMMEFTTVISTTYAFSVYNYIHCDDFLVVLWKWVHVDLPKRNVNSSSFVRALTAETQRVLNVSFEFNDNDTRHVDKFIVIPSSLQRWFMLQMVLGTTKNWKRNPGSILSWISLHVQFLAFVSKWTLRRIAGKSSPQQQQLPPAQQFSYNALNCYHISLMLGLLRWFTDLVTYLSQEIFLATVTTKTLDGQEAKNDPAVLYLATNPMTFINLLLSKIVRWLFLFILRAIRGIEAFLTLMVKQEQAMNNPLGVAMLTLRKFKFIYNSCPIPLAQFEKILMEVDKHLQSLYSNDQLQENVKQAVELELLKNNQTPRAFFAGIINHVNKLFKTQLLEAMDIPSLYFYDTRWLQIQDSEPQQLANGYRVDGINKFIISSNAELRKCTRCGQVSAVQNSKSMQNQVSLLFTRNCLCGGIWLNESVLEKAQKENQT